MPYRTKPGFIIWRGAIAAAIDLLKRAADLVAPTAAADEVSSFAAPIISNIYAYLSGAYQHYGLYHDSNDWARTAIEFGERRNVSFAQAIGYEFLAENGIHAGDYHAGLQFAEKEREIVERIHSRERRAWTHFSIAFISFLLGDLTRAEHEYAEGIVLAETIGERRVAALLKGNYAVVQAEQACKLAPAPLKLNDCWTWPWILPFRISKRAKRPDCSTCDSTAIAAWLKFIFGAVSWKTLSASAPRQRRLFPVPSHG